VSLYFFNVLLKVYVLYLLYGSVFLRAALQCAWYVLRSVHRTLKSLGIHERLPTVVVVCETEVCGDRVRRDTACL
jgi:hypothetical protein